MRFTELLAEIKATYPEESHKFHCIATRYYIGAITAEDLDRLIDTVP